MDSFRSNVVPAAWLNSMSRPAATGSTIWHPLPAPIQHDADRLSGRSVSLLFFSREEPRMHVHVSHPNGEAKFWLKSEVELATQTGLAAHLVHEARQLVENHLPEIIDACDRHFPG